MREIDQEKVRADWERIGAKFSPEMWDTTVDVNAPLSARERWEFRHQSELATFLKHVRLTQDSAVLELGCGAGRWAVSLAPQVGRFVGVDFAENSLVLARRRAEHRGLTGVEFHRASVTEFEPPGKFDVIYASGVLPCLRDDEILEMLPKWRAALAPGGQFVSRDSLVRSGPTLVKSGGYHAIHRNRNDFVALVESAGFKKVWADYAFGWDVASRAWQYVPERLKKAPGFARAYSAALGVQARLPALMRGLMAAKDGTKRILGRQLHSHEFHLFEVASKGGGESDGPGETVR